MRVALGIGLALLACRSTPQEPYVRLSGKGPVIEGGPVAPARLLAFWATWCPSCRDETAELVALARKPPRDLVVVVISEDEEPTAINRFFGGPPPAVLHLRQDAEGKLASELGARTLPVTFLEVEGTLRARFDGARRWDSRMRPTLERLLDR